MSRLRTLFDKLHPVFKDGALRKAWPLYEAIETFAFTTDRRTGSDPHIRDALDFKRMMFMVVVALLPCCFMAMWNTGLQANLAIQQLGLDTVPTWRAMIMDSVGYDPDSFFANLIHGALFFLPGVQPYRALIRAVPYVTAGVALVYYFARAGRGREPA